eukprot:TRINITY_DN2303_c0_g2_i1.p1 TRINITY_DN2303_c0_g2~~TRINITY_DN2303_c0_g2_i1.p1  ORF type:complete len:187 (-),score=24.54 TRINITY_DN2303_c0_g2_i1:86-646(-)
MYHRKLNRILNEKVTQTRNPKYRGKPFLYEHKKIRDEIFRSHDFPKLRRSTKYRKDGTVLESRYETKRHLEDITFQAPQFGFDYRLTASKEDPLSQAQAEASEKTLQLIRKKDRLSYIFEYISFDLTKVDSKIGGETTSTFEMELEIIDHRKLFDAWNQHRRHNQPANLIEIARTFTANMRKFASL